MHRSRSDSILLQPIPEAKEVTEAASLFHRHDAAMIGLQEANKSLEDYVAKIVNDDPDLYAAMGGSDSVRRMNPHIEILQPPNDLTDLAAFRVCGGLDEGYKCAGIQSRDEWVGRRLCDIACFAPRDGAACANDIIQNEWSNLGVSVGSCLGMETLHLGFTVPFEIDGKLCFVNCGIELHEYPNNARGSEFTGAMMFLDTFKRSILPSTCLLEFASATLREYMCVDYPRKFVWHSSVFTIKNTFIDFQTDGPEPEPSSSPSKCGVLEDTTRCEPTGEKLRERMNSMWANSRILNNIKAKVGKSHSRGVRGEMGDDIKWIQEGQLRANTKVDGPAFNDGNTHGKGLNKYPETHHHHQHSTVPYYRPHTRPEFERPWRTEEEVATYDIREPVLFPSSPDFDQEHTQKVSDSHPQQWHRTKPEGADRAVHQCYGPAHTSTMNHNKNRPRLEEAAHSSYQRPYEENRRDITPKPYYPQRPWNTTTTTTTSAPNPQGKLLSVPDERTSAPHVRVGSRVPIPQERYAGNPGLVGQKQAKEKKVIGSHVKADESGGSTREEYSECANCGRFLPEGFFTSPSPGFPVGASSSSSTQTSIKELAPGYRTCVDCQPSVFTRPAWGHNKNMRVTTTRGEERPSSQQQHNTFASSTKNPTPGVMTARTTLMVGTPMAPHARAHIPNPRTEELIPRVGTQHQPSVGKESETQIWAPPLTSSGGKKRAHHASTTVGKRDARSIGLKEEQIGDTRICSTLGAPSGSRLQSGSRMFTPINAASSRVDSRAADTSAGPTGAIVEGSSAATTRDMVEKPVPLLKIGDNVELHSFANAYWLQGLKATVSNVFAETRNGGRRSRVRAQILYDDPSLANKQGYPMTVPMQNLRLQTKDRME